MGCSIASEKRKISLSQNIAKVSTMKEIMLKPGLFVSENDNKFLEIYKIGSILGTGSYGEVRSCYHRENNEKRAVKIFKKQHYSSESKKSKLLSEISVLKSLDHPNIIKIFEFFEDSKRIYIVMEYCGGGELFTEIIKRKNFNEIHAAQIMHQILSVLAYLHEKSIIHRDIKPENILLEEQYEALNIKIIDFGTAIKTHGSPVTGVIGSLYYMAPEVFSGQYNEKVDI